MKLNGISTVWAIPQVSYYQMVQPIVPVMANRLKHILESPEVCATTDLAMYVSGAIPIFTLRVLMNLPVFRIPNNIVKIEVSFW